MKTVTTLNLKGKPEITNAILGNQQNLKDTDEGVQCHLHISDVFTLKQQMNTLKECIQIEDEYKFITFLGTNKEELVKMAEEALAMIEEEQEKLAEAECSETTDKMLAQLKQENPELPDGSKYVPIYREESVDLIWRGHIVSRYTSQSNITKSGKADIDLIKQMIEVEEGIADTPFRVYHVDFSSHFYVVDDAGKFQIYSENSLYKSTADIINKCVESAKKIPEMEKNTRKAQALINKVDPDDMDIYASVDVRIETFCMSFCSDNKHVISYNREPIEKFEKALAELAEAVKQVA